MEYTKNEWRQDTPITAEKLNNIEDGIKAATDAINNFEPHYVKACNVARKLKELLPSSTGDVEEWVATEDCWLGFYVSGDKDDDDASVVKVDGVVVFSAAMDSSSSSIDNTFTLPPSFFVKRGATITVTRGRPEITCTVYGCL